MKIGSRSWGLAFLPLSALVLACSPAGGQRPASSGEPTSSTAAPTPETDAPLASAGAPAASAPAVVAGAKRPEGGKAPEPAASSSDVVGAPPELGTWIRIDTIETKGPLGTETVRGVLAPQLDASLECYSKKVGKQAKRPEGSLNFRFTISKKGAAQGVEPIGKSALDAAFMSCVLGAVRKGVFPGGSDQTRATVSLIAPPASR